MKKQFEKNLFRFLLHFIGKQRFNFILFTVFCIINASSISIWPKITGDLIDLINNYTEDKSQFFTINLKFLLAAIGFWLLIEVTTRMQFVMLAVVMPRLEANIKSYLYSRVSQNSYEFYMHSHLGSISNKIGDLPRGAFYAMDIFFTTFIPLIIALAISSALFAELHKTIALILLSWIALHIILSAIFSFRSIHLSSLHAHAKSDTQGSIVDVLSNILSVKLFSNVSQEIRRIRNLQEKEVKRNRNTLFYIEVMKLSLGVIAFISVSFLFYTTIKFWQNGVITLGDVILVIGSTLNLWNLIRYATEEMSYFIREIGVCRQSLDLLEWEIDDSDANTKEIEIGKGEIVFEDVTFKYKNNTNKSIFANKSLVIEGGQKVGLVGFSGSGKTTFAKLILRLFDLESGNILIDNQNIATVSIQSLRDNVTFIPQEPYLFNRTIRENIAYNNPDATFEEVKSAAKLARCDDFIKTMANGYDTIVGERGSLLSGGQKQRLMIARSILKNTPIVIMDEATSALDTVTEEKIKQGLDYISKGKTTLVIAHRLSTLADMDRILVFHNGKVVEDGTHKDLLKNGKHYKKLWQMQNEGYLPD